MSDCGAQISQNITQLNFENIIMLNQFFNILFYNIVKIYG